MSTTNNENHHHHHHSHHRPDDTGIFRKRMSDHVKRIRIIRRAVYWVVIALAVLVSLAVVYAYIIDRG
ncbi:MAG: hypothetical protein J5735_04095 [Prevotella sp.]|nr:hypothetical protein [Prevotella sp.]